MEEEIEEKDSDKNVPYKCRPAPPPPSIWKICWCNFLLFPRVRIPFPALHCMVPGLPFPFTQPIESGRHRESRQRSSLISVFNTEGRGLHVRQVEIPSQLAHIPLRAEAGVLKKLSLAGLAKLSPLRYSWLRFGLVSAGYCGLGESTIGWCTQPANSQLIPLSMVKYLRLVRLA